MRPGRAKETDFDPKAVAYAILDNSEFVKGAIILSGITFLIREYLRSLRLNSY